jgi:hypothetical protein
MANRKPGPANISRHTLQHQHRTREQASFQLLDAIEQLYPDRTKALRRIGEQLIAAVSDEHPEDDDDNRLAVKEFESAVESWTTENQIRCDAVVAAARKYAVNEGPAVGITINAEFNERGDLVRHDRGIVAYPFNETRDEFVRRAAEYYDELAQRFIGQGATRGTVKREASDHFRYLAAHYVGGHSFAEISDDASRFNVASRSPKTVAEESRKVAALIGLSLRNTPGPRPGSRLRKPAHRAKRRTSRVQRRR